MATRIASRLRHPTLLAEIKKVVVGLGDNIMMPPRPRLRRSAPVLRGLYLNDGGPEGMIFLEPRLLPALLISDELIRSVIGPGAVIDRPPGWELRSGLVRFGKRVEPDETYYLLHCLFGLIAACGGTIVMVYTIKHLLRERERRLRRGRGADLGQGGGGGPGPDGPGPSGGWRFPPSRGLLHLMDTEASVAGPCGRGSRRFGRTLGLLDLVGGGGMDDAEGDGQGPGDGAAGGEDQESDSNVSLSADLAMFLAFLPSQISICSFQEISKRTQIPLLHNLALERKISYLNFASFLRRTWSSVHILIRILKY
jgi:hypothetical protein